MNVRHERLESDLLRVITDIIRNDVKNRDLMLVSITKVELTKDLAQAKVLFTSLGGSDKQQADLKALNEAKGFIKSQISKKVKMRKIPNITFSYDNRSDIRNDFEKLLKTIKK